MTTEKMPTFQKQQKDLVKQIRTGQVRGSEDRRVKVYQELFFNNIEGFCANGFPVLKSVLPVPVWNAWVRAFLVHSECHSPYFVDIAEQYLGFLNETLLPVLSQAAPSIDVEGQTNLGGWAEVLPDYSNMDNHTQILLNAVNLHNYPWLLELAHYEWVELYVSTREPQQGVCSSDLGELMQNNIRVRLADSALPLAYQHPVQTIKVGNVEGITESLTSLLVYQAWQFTSTKVEQGDTQFVLIDLVSVHLLHFLQNHSATFNDMLEFLQTSSVGLTLEQATHFLTQALPDFVERGVLISD